MHVRATRIDRKASRADGVAAQHCRDDENRSNFLKQDAPAGDPSRQDVRQSEATEIGNSIQAVEALSLAMKMRENRSCPTNTVSTEDPVADTLDFAAEATAPKRRTPRRCAPTLEASMSGGRFALARRCYVPPGNRQQSALRYADHLSIASIVSSSAAGEIRNVPV
jgi:hypothetical protein